jgi:hypothetical protein
MIAREMRVVDADAAHPSTPFALAPPAAGRPASSTSNLLPAFFFGSGYTGIAMLLAGAWTGAWSWNAMLGLYFAGGMCVVLGGLGVLPYVLVRSSREKLLRGMLAAAALLATIASLQGIGRAALEVRVSTLAPALQPLADDLARDGRFRDVDFSGSSWLRLNGFEGDIEPSDPQQVRALEAVLRRDGITRADVAALRARMAAAGVDDVETTDGHVAFDDAEIGRWVLLYARPGHPLPSSATPVMTWVGWRSKPVGGGWYLLRHDAPRSDDH